MAAAVREGIGMRLSLRFVLPLLLVLGLLAYALVPLADRYTAQWFVRDLDLRSTLIANTMQDPLRDLLETGNRARVETFFANVLRDQRLYALGFCPADHSAPITTSMLPSTIQCDSVLREQTAQRLLDTPQGQLLVSVRPVSVDAQPVGDLVLVHDMSFMARRSVETRRYLFYFFGGLALVVSLITVVIAQISWRGWVSGLQALTRGEGLIRPISRAAPPELQPIARDLRTLISDLQAEQHARDETQLSWTPETLRQVLHTDLRDAEVIVVSNREPYIHIAEPAGVRVSRPASGMVTALEPVMRACSGTWIAHGGGSADAQVVDRHDHVAVPPDAPSYQLRRIWLTPEEEAGYYYGFANEGLWPLCHIAHVRPTFRSADWDEYVKVNQRFADAVVAEAGSRDPVVLVQDYHFALLPRMVRNALPRATIISFWHIPWPNPEAFGICPWREQLLDGMLGSTILGFHTQFHCNNFVDTVDRFVEARVDRETLNVSYQHEITAVKRYPVSIAWPPSPELLAKPVPDCRRDVRLRYGLADTHRVAVGVDRLDYTKGIEERFRAVERLLETQSEWIGRFTLIQVAAPSRSNIEEYQHYGARVRALADEINQRFTGDGAPPIILRAEHNQPVQIYEYYRAADVCMVTSLHDGMNLVAKEFIAARDDERGVLVLSRFTGAARELPEALIVNPYDMDQCAAALELALTMPEPEQCVRMRHMRGLVREFNVYRWAGRMLIDAARMRTRRRLLNRSAPRFSRREPAAADR